MHFKLMGDFFFFFFPEKTMSLYTVFLVIILGDIFLQMLIAVLTGFNASHCHSGVDSEEHTVT